MIISVHRLGLDTFMLSCFKCVTENVDGCLKQDYSSRLNWIGPNMCLSNISLQSVVYSDNCLSTVSICWNDEERAKQSRFGGTLQRHLCTIIVFFYVPLVFLRTQRQSEQRAEIKHRLWAYCLVWEEILTLITMRAAHLPKTRGNRTKNTAA